MDQLSDRALAAFRILSWVGIVEQLARTAATRTLKGVGLTYPEFSLLTHFSHGHPPEKTVTGIAADMQQTQPTVTKTVQKLLAKGLLKAGANNADGRSRLLTLTAKGQQAQLRAIARLAPDLAAIFADWPANDLQQLFALLGRLKTHLDTNRPT